MNKGHGVARTIPVPSDSKTRPLRRFSNRPNYCADWTWVRNVSAGTIRQLARGLYDYPVQDSVLGTVAPFADAIAHALAARDAIRLQPSGAYAANVLGLSEQVPSRIVFLTDGPARKVKIGKREILLQHTTSRNMATAGRKSGTLIQALRYLGQDQVDKKILATIRRQITDSDRPILRDDLRYAPAWIADLLRPFTATPSES